MISAKERERALLLISEAVCSGARERLACELVGISERTLLRWKNQKKNEKSVEDKRVKAGSLLGMGNMVFNWRESWRSVAFYRKSVILELCFIQEY